MVKFKGSWNYQSYRPDPGSLAADYKPPTFVPWSRPGVVTIDADGKTGKLEFTGVPPIKLNIQVTDGSPARLSVSAVMELPKGQFTNELEGWFVPAKLGEKVGEDNPLIVRGTIVQTSEDIAPKDKQPIYTTGFFVLQPRPPEPLKLDS